MGGEEKAIVGVGNGICGTWRWEKVWHLGTAENVSAADTQDRYEGGYRE